MSSSPLYRILAFLSDAMRVWGQTPEYSQFCTLFVQRSTKFKTGDLLLFNYLVLSANDIKLDLLTTMNEKTMHTMNKKIV